MVTGAADTYIVKQQTKWMRLSSLWSTLLCFLAGLSLFVGTEMTDRFSAWTINSAITAAFLGAAYWGAGIFLNLLSAREHDWARARIAVLPTFVFGVLGLVSTLLNLDRFHTNSGAWYTQALTWLWLIPYAVGPVLAVIILVHQLRQPGGDPPPTGTLPNWLRFVLLVQAIILLGIGATLFIAPQSATVVWPWALTALTAKVTAAWLIGLGLGAVQVVWENDWARIFPAAVCYTIFALLEFVVLVRYPGGLDWGRPQAWLYVVILLSILIAGAYTWLGTRAYSSRTQLSERPVSSSA